MTKHSFKLGDFIIIEQFEEGCVDDYTCISFRDVGYKKIKPKYYKGSAFLTKNILGRDGVLNFSGWTRDGDISKLELGVKDVAGMITYRDSLPAWEKTRFYSNDIVCYVNNIFYSKTHRLVAEKTAKNIVKAFCRARGINVLCQR